MTARPETYADDRRTVYHNRLDLATDAVDHIHRRPVSSRMSAVISVNILTTLKVPVELNRSPLGRNKELQNPARMLRIHHLALWSNTVLQQRIKGFGHQGATLQSVGKELASAVGYPFVKRPPFVLPTDGSIPPIQMRAQRVPFALRISEELDLLIDQNILELVQSTHRPRRLCLSSKMMVLLECAAITSVLYFGPHLTRTGRFQFGASERFMTSVVPSLVSASSVPPPFEDLTSVLSFGFSFISSSWVN
ncbi:hypothetical protein T11_1916 [Trichinella zimbabwensis]|uniref:Uncharacterized protein n=1 Tax=Trichinella zimbabwensis TaxID=268475 RepID=A0A0V1HMP3_9BILA|nr:hypothetical protein T11_1916 [Trichinella zimbabwensis]